MNKNESLLQYVGKTNGVTLFNGRFDNIKRLYPELINCYKRSSMSNTFVEFTHINDVCNIPKGIAFIILTNASDNAILELSFRVTDMPLIVFNSITTPTYGEINNCEHAGIILTDDTTIFAQRTDNYKYAASMDFTLCKTIHNIDHIHDSDKINVFRPFFE